MKKLIIFDLDGTLLDTIADLGTSVNIALRKHGFPEHDIETYRFMVGNGLTKLIERALPDDQRDVFVIEQVKQTFLNHYLPHSGDYTKPYPGIQELLLKLQNQGIRMAVASNKVHEATEKVVAHFFPSIHFDIVLGQREGIPTKPDPSILFSILAHTGCNANETLYVGDSGVDVVTATNAGIAFTGVLWGFRPKEELASFGATSFVSTPKEILSLLK
ncbi:MAG: HAD family hydrolase [Microbacter sp.]